MPVHSESSSDITMMDADVEAGSKEKAIDAIPASSPSDQGVQEKTVPSQSPQSYPAPPDGGTMAWLVVLGAWCTSFCSFGWLNSIGVFQEYYQEELLRGLSASTIAWIPSLQLFFMLAMGPLVGALDDKYGPRPLIVGGTLLHVFGLMMASISTEYYQLILAQGVCSAIGVSGLYQPVINVIPQWFTRRRGAAFGLLATGSSLGGVIFPIMVGRLTKQIGFGWSMRISAFLILALLIVANLTIRPIRPPVPRHIGLSNFTKPLMEVDFLMLCFGLLLFTFGLYIPADYLPLEAASAGMDPSLVQYILPILNAASLFGRALSGFASDKFGRYNVFVTVCFLSGLWILALWIPAPNTAARIAFAALYGFFSGAYVALIAALVIHISPLAESGIRIGIMFLILAPSGLTGNPISGAILAAGHGHWLGAKLFGGVMCLAGTVFIFLVRVRKVGWKLNVVF